MEKVLFLNRKCRLCANLKGLRYIQFAQCEFHRNFNVFNPDSDPGAYHVRCQVHYKKAAQRSHHHPLNVVYQFINHTRLAGDLSLPYIRRLIFQLRVIQTVEQGYRP